MHEFSLKNQAVGYFFHKFNINREKTFSQNDRNKLFSMVIKHRQTMSRVEAEYSRCMPTVVSEIT